MAWPAHFSLMNATGLRSESGLGSAQMDHNSDDEPGFYDPEYYACKQASDRPRPVGPDWWEGWWPEGGIDSLEGLERWVDERLDEAIWLARQSSSSLHSL